VEERPPGAIAGDAGIRLVPLKIGVEMLRLALARPSRILEDGHASAVAGRKLLANSVTMPQEDHAHHGPEEDVERRLAVGVAIPEVGTVLEQYPARVVVPLVTDSDMERCA